MGSIELSIIGKKTEPIVFEYSWKDVVLYALGVGAGPEDLPFIYENAPGGLKVLPSFCVIPSFRAYPALGKNIDYSQLVHAHQFIRIYRPLLPEGKVTCVGEVTNIFDKGNKAAFHIRISGYSEPTLHLFDTEWVTYCMGAGGFSGNSGPKTELVRPPQGKDPDCTRIEKVAENQAAIYRLSGDLYPLHIDPGFARQRGFDRPVLHGLCTYGFAVRTIVRDVLNGEVEPFKSFKASFSRPVYMGDTLRKDCWITGNLVFIEMKTENGVVIRNAIAEIS